MNSPTIETERLILRKFTEDDMEALFLILKDEEVNQFLPWYPMKILKKPGSSMKKDMLQNMQSHRLMRMLFALKRIITHRIY